MGQIRVMRLGLRVVPVHRTTSGSGTLCRIYGINPTYSIEWKSMYSVPTYIEVLKFGFELGFKVCRLHETRGLYI